MGQKGALSLTKQVTLLAIAYALVVALLTGRPVSLFTLIVEDLVSLGAVTAAAGASLVVVKAWASRHDGEGGRPSAILRAAVQEQWQADRGVGVLLPLVAAAFTLGGYNLFKQFAMPKADFAFGKLLSTTERGLLGADAWRLTHALFPYAWQTKMLDLAYHAWFLPMVGGIALCCFAGSRRLLAERYVATYVLTWVVQGTLLSWLLPAAGPCFVDKFRPVTQFVPLMQRLHAQSTALVAEGWGGLAALDYQAGLLRTFGASEPILGGGISAMPSLHNALAVLFAAAAFRIDRRLGFAAAGYAGVIWIGSVHLGWHYALDGIVGAACCLVTWWACGLWQRRRVSSPEAAGAVPLLA